jgi:hypothetical protein
VLLFIATMNIAFSASLEAYSSWNGNFNSVDLATGSANLIPASPGFWHLGYAPDGTLYGLSRSDDKLYQFIDPAQGTTQLLATLPENSTGSGFTVLPDGSFIYFTLGFQTNNLYRYSIDTGAMSFLGNISSAGLLSDIESSPDGVLYGITGINLEDRRL